MNKIKQIIILYLLIITCLNASNNKVVLGGIENSVNSQISFKILKDAYFRIGLDLHVKEYPALRSLLSSNKGILDGEIHRIDGINKKFKNLIKVPFVINSIDGYVFTKNKDLKVTNWKDLKDKKVAIIRGIRYTEIATEDMSRVVVSNVPTMIKTLDKGSVDFFVYTEHEIKKELQKMNIKDIYKIKPFIDRKNLYHYVHKKNVHIIDDLIKALEEVKSEGLFEKYRDEVIKDYLK